MWSDIYVARVRGDVNAAVLSVCKFDIYTARKRSGDSTSDVGCADAVYKDGVSCLRLVSQILVSEC